MSGLIGALVGKRGRHDRLLRIENSFRAPAIEILEVPPASSGQAILVGCTALVFSALVWVYLGRLDIVASAKGRIVSLAETKTIQPVETGIVRAINVHEGEHVKAGTVLVELNSTQAMADFERARRQSLQDRLDIVRLGALIEAAEIDKTPVLADIPDMPRLLMDATRTRMLQQASEQNAKVGSLDAQIAEKAGEIRETEAQIIQSRELLPLLSSEKFIRDRSVTLGVGNKIDQLEIHQRVVQQAQGLSAQRAHQTENIANLESFVAQRRGAIRNYENQNWSDQEKASTDQLQADDDMQKARDRIRSEMLVSPVDGTVQQLVLTTVGGVVTPGQSLMSVVPDDAHLVADVMLDNRDIGFIHAGQMAEVKVTAFSYTRYNAISGNVERISLDAAVDNHAMPLETSDRVPEGAATDATSSRSPQDGYIARITLSRDWVQTELGIGHLEPGMEVTADVKTGTRRIIGYLLGPALQAVHDSMRER